MKAEREMQMRLLDLQALDIRLTQLAHQKANLPEADELEKATREVDDLTANHTRARAEARDTEHALGKAEADVAQVRTRAERDRARMESGQGGAKEIQALEHELQTLARRQTELEEIELETMERLEALTRHTAELDSQRQQAMARQEELEARIGESLTSIETEREDVQRRRDDLAPTVDGDLLALYEKLRTATGIGAAALVSRRCQGCHMELGGAELSRIRQAMSNEVLRCDECGRILVRTKESGL